MQQYDVVVIGGGSGGCACAIRASDLGQKVALVEYRTPDGLGGTCINRGCIPTKTLLEASHLLSRLEQAGQFGISVSNVTFDMRQMVARKNAIVNTLRFGLENYVLKPRNIDIKKGWGRLLDAHAVEVTGPQGTEILRASNIVLATGSEPALIPAFNVDRKDIITSDEALNLSEIPRDMLIVGAGAIGIEFATWLSALKTKVTIVEMLDQVLPGFADKELAAEAERLLKKKGISVRTGIRVSKIEPRGGKVVSFLGSGEAVETAKVLVSIGRALNVKNIGLESLGIETRNGRIPVDERMRTKVPNVFAVGDIVPGPQLSHKAQREGIVAAETIAGLDSKMDYRVVPWVVFSDPEVASVGLTEEQSLEAGLEVVTGKVPFTANERANTMRSVEGFVKIVARKDTKEVVGAQIIGPGASVLIAELALAMDRRIRVDEISNLIHAHPTLPEAVMEAAKSALGKAFHRARR